MPVRAARPRVRCLPGKGAPCGRRTPSSGWGAAGGLGAYAPQMVKNAGGIAVGVVGSPRKAEALRRPGCDVVLDRTEPGLGDASVLTRRLRGQGDVRPVGLRRPARRHRGHLRLQHRLRPPLRQPLPVDEPQTHRRQPRVYPLEQVGEAARRVQRDEHVGRVGVLCLAPKPARGVTEPELRLTLDPKGRHPFARDAADRAAG